MFSRKHLISTLVSISIVVILGVAQHFGVLPLGSSSVAEADASLDASLDDLFSVQEISDVDSGVGGDANSADVDEVDLVDGNDPPSAVESVETNATVVHVVDGDTLDADIDGLGKARIRLLGVNTPETVDPRKAVECFGKDASNFSKKTLKEGSRILLALDPQADERDKYGRLLRNVILPDGTDFNALLVREGYAYAYTSFPLSPERKVEIIRLEKEAKETNRGLWGDACETK